MPLTEEIRLQIFGSRDPTIFSLDLLSDGDSVYTPENLNENLGIRVVSHVTCVTVLLYSNTDDPATHIWHCKVYMVLQTVIII